MWHLTEAGFVPTLLLHCVTGDKKSLRWGRGDGQSLGGFKQPRAGVSHAAAALWGLVSCSSECNSRDHADTC